MGIGLPRLRGVVAVVCQSLPPVSLEDSDAHTLQEGLVCCLGHLKWYLGFGVSTIFTEIG